MTPFYWTRKLHNATWENNNVTPKAINTMPMLLTTTFLLDTILFPLGILLKRINKRETYSTP